MIVVTVPACNESKNLRKCVDVLLKETSQLGEDFRILIAEDGSTDGTDQIAQELEQLHPQVTHLHSQQKLGKGLALKRAFSTIDGDIYAFVDCDLATDMKYFPQLINAIREGNDLATGSRYIKGAKVDRPFLRDVTSRVYNNLIRMIYKDKVYDHQIGFKAFSKRLIKDELNRVVRWQRISLVDNLRHELLKIQSGPDCEEIKVVMGLLKNEIFFDDDDNHNFYLLMKKG